MLENARRSILASERKKGAAEQCAYARVTQVHESALEKRGPRKGRGKKVKGARAELLLLLGSELTHKKGGVVRPAQVARGVFQLFPRPCRVRDAHFCTHTYNIHARAHVGKRIFPLPPQKQQPFRPPRRKVKYSIGCFSIGQWAPILCPAPDGFLGLLTTRQFFFFEGRFVPLNAGPGVIDAPNG